MPIVISLPKMVFGIETAKPISNLPPDFKSLKIRMRNTEFAWAFVRTASGIEKWALEDEGETWKLVFKQATNERHKNEQEQG